MRLPRWLAPVGAYVLAIAVAVAGFRSVEVERQHDRELAERQRATDCLNSWMIREDLRRSVAIAAGAGAEALIQVAGGERPDLVASYRTAVAAEVARARDQIPDPSCDRSAALRRLDR